MTPDREARLMHAYVDDEVDLQTRLQIEARLADDATLRAQVQALRAQQQAVREHATYHAAPADLRAVLFPQAEATPAASGPIDVAQRSPSAWSAWWTWRPAMAMAAMVALVAIGAQFVWFPARETDRVLDQVVASHVRSTLGEHLVDIASSDHHVVKPWLSNKLDFSPPVGDARLGNATFVGGRVDYLDGRPVAALVYREGAHVAQVFVWPVRTTDRAPAFVDQRGFQVAHWTRQGMAYWVISDVNRDAFTAFVEAVNAVENVR